MHFSKLKRSPWTKPYSTDVPAQAGVYECEWTGMLRDKELWFNFWDGSRWHWGAEEPESCDRDDPIRTAIVSEGMRRWRGITRKAAFDALPAKVRADLTENADYLAG